MVMQSRFTLGVKKVKVEELVRREVLGLQLYDGESGLERKLDERFVKLDLNENFAVTIDAVRELLSDACQDIDVRSYPPSYGSMAIKAVSDFLGVRESEISVGSALFILSATSTIFNPADFLAHSNTFGLIGMFAFIREYGIQSSFLLFAGKEEYNGSFLSFVFSLNLY